MEIRIFFGYQFHNECFYSVGPFPGDDSDHILDKAICNPSCPGSIVGDGSCGGYVGWSELQTIIYLTLSVTGQMTVFVSRTRHSFWSRRPGYTLSVACAIAQIIATVVSVYVPYSFKIDSYIDIDIGDKSYPTPVIMNGFDWKMAGFIWAWCLIVFVISDWAKVYFYYALDNDNMLDKDVQQIKKTKRPFIPTEGGVSKKNYEVKRKIEKNEVVNDNYKCHQCDAIFKQLSSLKRHYRIHTNEKPYSCEICNKCFTQSCTLQAHKRLHTGEKPYLCRYCSKSFRQSTNLRSHLKRLHPSQFQLLLQQNMISQNKTK